MDRIKGINRRVAERITAAVGTMWAAAAFAAIALISLPAAIRAGDTLTLVDWVAQTFLQLVLLSIIMVGQQRSSEKISNDIEETHAATLAEFEFAKQAREVADQELAEIKKMAAEIHTILKDVERPDK
jgi:DNA integrity scanning protein DisA with diadenylate cyclase activity